MLKISPRTLWIAVIAVAVALALFFWLYSHLGGRFTRMQLTPLGEPNAQPKKFCCNPTITPYQCNEIINGRPPCNNGAEMVFSETTPENCVVACAAIGNRPPVPFPRENNPFCCNPTVQPIHCTLVDDNNPCTAINEKQYYVGNFPACEAACSRDANPPTQRSSSSSRRSSSSSSACAGVGETCGVLLNDGIVEKTMRCCDPNLDCAPYYLGSWDTKPSCWNPPRQ